MTWFYNHIFAENFVNSLQAIITKRTKFWPKSSHFMSSHAIFDIPHVHGACMCKLGESSIFRIQIQTWMSTNLRFCFYFSIKIRRAAFDDDGKKSMMTNSNYCLASFRRSWSCEQYRLKACTNLKENKLFLTLFNNSNSFPQKNDG